MEVLIKPTYVYNKTAIAVDQYKGSLSKFRSSRQIWGFSCAWDGMVRLKQEHTLLPEAGGDLVGYENDMTILTWHTVPLSTHGSMLQKHPPIPWSLADQDKSEDPLTPLAGLERWVDAEAGSPIATHSCWRFGKGIEIIWQHSHGILPLSSYVIMLQKHPAIHWSLAAETKSEVSILRA